MQAGDTEMQDRRGFLKHGSAAVAGLLAAGLLDNLMRPLMTGGFKLILMLVPGAEPLLRHSIGL